MAHNQLSTKNDKYRLDDVIRAGVQKPLTRARMTVSSRYAVRTSAAATCRFRPEQWVYNRDTKEHGLVRHVYKKDGVIMYKAWLPATPDLMRWGHFVSDWAEYALERADNVLAQPDRLANSR
jgi:hypothetical protein